MFTIIMLGNKSTSNTSHGGILIFYYKGNYVLQCVSVNSRPLVYIVIDNIIEHTLESVDDVYTNSVTCIINTIVQCCTEYTLLNPH